MFTLNRISTLNKFLFSFKNLIKFKSSYSYAFEPSLEPYSVQTIGQLIDACAEDSGGKTACISVHQDIKRTYFELKSDINKLAHSLKSIGCEKGDRIGIWSPNCYEWLLTQYATAKIGAILVNVNPGYRAKELEYCLNLVGCHTLICSQTFLTTNYCEILNSISPNILLNTNGTEVMSEKIPSLRNIIMLNSGSHEREIAPSNVVRFDDFLLSANISVDSIEDVSQPDDSINIQFTSGTTGHPKGATLTHHNIIQNATFIAKRIVEDVDDSSHLKVCVPNPLYHCFGSVLGSILVAIKRGILVLPAPIFNAHKTLEAVHNYKCNLVYGTPTMYVDILNSQIDKYNTSSLVRGISFKNKQTMVSILLNWTGLMAGAPCPPPLIEEVHRKIPTMNILIPYGSTESSPVVTQTSIFDTKKRRLESVGRPIDHIEIKVIDPKTGQLVRTGETGEVCSRGHSNFVGYWGQKQQTDEVLDQNRWYHTGDMGFMDESGYLYINGRIKDMIIRGGENIYPKEIEDFLMSNPFIADAHVVGVPHERLGEDLVAYIKLKDEHNLDPIAVKEFCQGKISHFKIPANIEFVNDFPRTVTGKVQKFKLRKLAEKQFKKS